LGCLAALVAATSCARPRSDAPPPPESFEIASAAPGALGALAAGTDAAPPAVILEPEPAVPLPEEEGEEPEDDGGMAPSDGGVLSDPETVPL
jgi:hypothetical protein